MPEPRAPDPRSVALRIAPGSGAVRLRRLSRGLVNESYEVRRDGRRFALRIRTRDRTAAELDPWWECRLLEAASAAGIGPEVDYFDPDGGVLLTRWIVGRSWTRRAALKPANRRRVVQLIHAIQQIKPPDPARLMMPARWIAHYRASGCGAASHLQAQADRHLEALAGLPATSPVLCHGDLHRFNLIDRDFSLVALDWEYAHVSEPFWDLAGWSCSNDLAVAEGEGMLAEYLGRGARRVESERLRMLRWLFDFVCLQWSGSFLAASSGPAANTIGARAAALEARLSASAYGPES